MLFLIDPNTRVLQLIFFLNSSAKLLLNVHIKSADKYSFSSESSLKKLFVLKKLHFSFKKDL